VTLLPAAVLAAVLVPAAPAHADLVGTTTTSDVVLKNSCRRHPVHYSFAVSPDTLLWQTKISLLDPDGRTSEGIDLTSVDDDPTSGTVRFLFCGSYAPGTWTVHTTGSYQLVPGLNIPIDVADSTFKVRRTPSRTTLHAARLDGGRYRLTALVEEQRRAGFRPTTSAEVLFQRKVDGTWRALRGSRTFTDHGLASYVVHATPGTRVRAVTAHAGYLGGSTSRGRTLG
jgi:hypothetical protein